MPELPEVETIRRGLERNVVGHTIVSVKVTGSRTVRRQSAAELISSVERRRVLGTSRYGKYLVLRLGRQADPGDRAEPGDRACRADQAALVLHLRMSGQLLFVADRGRALEAHTHAVLRLEDESELRFVDPRTFGELFAASGLDVSGRPVELAGVGRDPLVEGMSASQLGLLVARRRTSLKAFLLDQRGVAGIGNLYADEICFRARLSPLRGVSSLGGADLRRLARAIRSVLSEAVELGGSSLRDASYRDLGGRLGRYQDHHVVYGRAGQPCPRCGSAIVQVRVVGRSAHLCPSCQV